MRRLYFASGSMLVADSTCKALLRYARALADSGRADVVILPVVGEDGIAASAHLLVGPASELFSIPVESSAQEPVGEDVIREMEEKTRALHPSRPAWHQEMTDIPGGFSDFEYELGEP